MGIAIDADHVSLAAVVRAFLQDKDAARAARAMLDVIAECTLAGLVGVIDNLADRVELDEVFSPRAWK